MLSECILQTFSFFSDKIDNILKKTIFEAQEIKEENGLKETVGKTLVQVMEIRETILERIKKIRRGRGRGLVSMTELIRIRGWRR